MTDPKAIYQRRNKTSGIKKMLEASKASQESDSTLQQSMIKAPSVKNGEPDIEFVYRELSKEDAKKLCVPHKHNQRFSDKLTMGAVADIFPSIEAAGCNSELAEALEINGKLHILKGLRRLYSVVNTSGDSYFRVLVATHMSEEDQFYRARVGDIYSKPSILDIGFRLAEKYKDGEAGVRLEELANQEKIALGKVSEAINFTKFPDFIYGAFPGLRYVKYKWARYLRSKVKELGKLEGKVPQIKVDEKFDSVDDAEAAAEEAFGHIKRLLERREEAPKNETWSQISPKKGIKLFVNGDQVSLKFDVNDLDPTLLKSLTELVQA